MPNLPEKPQSMTFEEFNDKYTISVNVHTTQNASLVKSDTSTVIHYDFMNEPYAVDDYMVYDSKTNEQVYFYEGDNQEHFLAELIEHFNIQD